MVTLLFKMKNLEFNSDYKKKEHLENLRKTKAKLKDEDLKPSPDHERVILCHILRKDGNFDEVRTRSTKIVESNESSNKYIDA